MSAWQNNLFSKIKVVLAHITVRCCMIQDFKRILFIVILNVNLFFFVIKISFYKCRLKYMTIPELVIC